MKQSGGSEPQAHGMALKAAIDRAHAAKSARAGRNTSAPSSPANNLFYQPRSSDSGSDAPSVTTPCTDEGGGFRRGEKAITMPALKFPNMSHLRSWKAMIGHALAVVSGHYENKEYGWYMEIETKDIEGRAIDKRERRFALLEAPLYLAVYKTCPPVLQKRTTEKETKYDDAGEL